MVFFLGLKLVHIPTFLCFVEAVYKYSKKMQVRMVIILLIFEFFPDFAGIS